MKTGNRKNDSRTVAFAACVIVLALGAAMYVAGCGGGATGTSHSVSPQAAAVATRVTGMVILKTAQQALARAPQEGKSAQKTAAQVDITNCGTVPDGYVPVPDADITVSGETTTARTNAGGCFSMDIQTPGLKIFTMRKINSRGGATILKKAANVQAGASIRFIDDDSISVLSTVSAIVVEEKLEKGEENIDCGAIEDYIESIETQEDVAAMSAAITAAADPEDDSVSDFDSIDASVVSAGVAVTEKPVILESTVTGSPAPNTGGDITVIVEVVSFDRDEAITGVTARLTTSGAAPIEKAMTAGDGGAYSATLSAPANNTITNVVYTLTITINDAGGGVTTYTLDDVVVSGLASICGNGSQESGETCDDNNTTTETCAYGLTSCTVCNAICQSVAGAASYCGDGSTDTGNGETCDDGADNGQPNHCNDTCSGTVPATCGNNVVESGEGCDDGNTTTEICTYGQTGCTVCNSSCQEAAGATSYCGDGSTDAGNSETCDDGTDNGQPNHCNSTCDGTTTPVCGNNATESGETCDDGNTTTEPCTYGQTSCTVCNAACQSVAGATSYCGDGSTDAGNSETCDDGADNGLPNHCNTSCDGIVPSSCGNSTTESGEDCDHGGESATCDADCSFVSCGDNTTNATAGETCDDGNTTTETCTYGQTSCTVCNATCQSVAGATSYCGDSNTDGGNGEACDDGNTTTETCTYGQTSCTVCDATCQSVAGATSYCGDSTTDASNGETCDDSNTTTETCTYGQTSCTVCNATCQSVAGATSYCGDGSTDAGNGETCDDGADNGQPNHCNSTCDGTTTPVCGNNATESGETCDDGNTTTELCTYGQTSCTVCNATCQSVAGATSYCGDSNTDGGNGEACDDGNTTTEPCTYGQTSCTVCDATCQSVAGATSYCGDSTTDAGNGEGCDDGNTTTEPCTYGQTSCTVCDASCQSVAGATSYCGDSTIDGGNGEACDDGNTTTETCTYGEESCTVCNATCQSVAGATSYCGDNTVDAGNGETCDDGGAVGGDGCSATCQSESMPPTLLDAGRYHNCAITGAGGVKCWGRSNYGQIGDGNTENRLVPVDVDGLTSGVESVTAGYNSCAVTTSGGLKCWGRNTEGQVGDNSTSNRYSPVNVDGLTSGVEAVSCGQRHCCALLDTGGVKCWGDNNNGELGDGTTNDRLTPVDVTGLASGVKVISVGSYHTCALTTAGGVKCWGANTGGRLGDNTEDDKSEPVDTVGLTSGVVDLFTGDSHNCAVTTGGGLKCWGSNGSGQLGNNSTSNALTPVNVTGLTSGVAGGGAGPSHTCALLTSGGLKCWGSNDYGEIGDGTSIEKHIPANVTGLSSGVSAVVGGNDHSCALLASGDIKCWGRNNYGQLGLNTTDNSSLPATVVNWP